MAAPSAKRVPPKVKLPSISGDIMMMPATGRMGMKTAKISSSMSPSQKVGIE